MILVADSGSTKTDWRLITKNAKIFAFKSEGINPYFHTPESITHTLKRFNLQPFNHADVDAVFFYGAGCSSDENIKLMVEGFRPVFNRAKIHILHDLLGAARALFKNEVGIAAILGTGSNSCLFIKSEITKTLGGQGYILGDEGSGMHLGRKVIRDFMNDLMPKDVLKSFVETYGLSKDEISVAVYKRDFPNRFLASFSPFVSDNIGHPYLSALADDAFNKFFNRYIIHFPNYRNYPLRIVGSVGFNYQSQIKEQAAKHDIKIDRFLRAPIEGLVDYHKVNNPDCHEQ